MVSKDLLRTQEGQRVERQDLEHAAYTSPRAVLGALPRDLILGTATPGTSVPTSFVVSGFAATASGTPAGSPPTITYTNSGIVTVTRGVGIFGTRVGGRVEFGLPLSGGADSRSQDISSLADGTWGVYVRFEYRDARFQNRIFWNPLGATPTETKRNVPTRRAEDWGLAVEAVSPGVEYTQVAEIVKTGTTLAITDRRQMLLDDDTSTGAALVDADWGGGTDRDPNRRLNGLGSLYQLLTALRRQLQDIIGDRWYSAVPVSLANALSLFLRTDGANSMASGAVINWVNDTGVIGAAFPVDRIQCRNFDGANAFTTDAGAEREVLNGGFADNQQSDPSRALVQDYAGFNDAGGGIYSSVNNEHIRHYAAGNGVDGEPDFYEIAVNAVFGAALGTWSRGDDAGEGSALVRFGKGAASGTIMEVLLRDETLANTWNDTIDPTAGWTRVAGFDNLKTVSTGGPAFRPGPRARAGIQYIAQFSGAVVLGSGSIAANSEADVVFNYTPVGGAVSGTPNNSSIGIIVHTWNFTVNPAGTVGLVMRAPPEHSTVFADQMTLRLLNTTAGALPSGNATLAVTGSIVRYENLV